MTPAREVRAAYIPLVDCAPLVAAHALGFAEEEGVRLVLSRETSWATLRDRISVRHLDVAHMLAPMPIAANLGLTPLPATLLAPMALGSGGNTITVSAPVWRELQDVGAPDDFDALGAVKAVGRIVSRRQEQRAPRLVIGIVHPHSVHFYQLAHWLSAGGIDPARDIDLVVLPPPLMPAALAGGQIDGFCAGEPCGSVAVASGMGRIVTTSAHIWRNGPEKVLGVRKGWAEEDPDRLAALIRAVYRAAVWCDDPNHRLALAELLARPEHLDQAPRIVQRSLERRLIGPLGGEIAVDGFMMFAACMLPWPGHAAWLYAQMVRRGEVQHSKAALAIAQSAFRPDLACAALAPLGIVLPEAEAATTPVNAPAAHGRPPGGALSLGQIRFFDGSIFDPQQIEAVMAEDVAGRSS